MSHSSLLTFVAQKPLDGPSRAVFGCDVQALVSAPLGNLVRVCFDPDDNRSSREGAKGIAELFLPSREGFRHVIFRERARSFVVGLAPNKDRADEIIRSIHHSVRSVAGRGGVGGKTIMPEPATGRPDGGAK